MQQRYVVKLENIICINVIFENLVILNFWEFCLFKIMNYICISIWVTRNENCFLKTIYKQDHYYFLTRILKKKKYKRLTYQKYSITVIFVNLLEWSLFFILFFLNKSIQTMQPPLLEIFIIYIARNYYILLEISLWQLKNVTHWF